MLKNLFMMLIAGTFLIFTGKLSFAMMCGEHSGHKTIAQAETGTQGQTEEAAEAEPKETVNAGNKICPVSGEKIDEEMKAAYEYEGKVYDFCCEMCIEEFKKDPEKYIKKAEEELKAESKEEATGQKMRLEHETESAGEQDVHRGHHH